MRSGKKRSRFLARTAGRASCWNLSTQSELLRTSIILGVIAMLVSLLPNVPNTLFKALSASGGAGIFTATASWFRRAVDCERWAIGIVRLAKHYSPETFGFNSLLLKLVGIAELWHRRHRSGGVFRSSAADPALSPGICRTHRFVDRDMVGGAFTYVAGLMARQ